MQTRPSSCCGTRPEWGGDCAARPRRRGSMNGTMRLLIVVGLCTLTLAACSGGRASGGADDAGTVADDSSHVATSGGTVALTGVASATFPPGAFASPQPVRVEQTSDPAAGSAFADSAALFRPQGRLGYEVHIDTGNAPPALPVQVTLNVPQAL